MPTAEIVSLLGGLAGLLGVILAFVPRLWERAKLRAQAGTESATEAKVRADATAVQIATSLDLVKRLSEQVETLVSERDGLRTHEREWNMRVSLLETELAKSQETLAVMSARFDECAEKLGMLLRRAGLDTPTHGPPHELN